MPGFVRLSTQDPEYFPSPSRNLLALHATICKVACTSGAATFIDYAMANNWAESDLNYQLLVNGGLAVSTV